MAAGVVLALLVGPFALAGGPADETATAETAGKRKGDAVQIQVRNRSRGETGLVSAGDGYSLRLSNTKEGGGGGAVYGCRAPDAPASRNLACLYADNLRGGKAFLFRSAGGPTVGHFELGDPSGPPFTTNATGLVQNLNADKVDGLDAEDLRGQRGPAGPKGDIGPTIGAWNGSFCNPNSSTYITCVTEEVDFPVEGRALLVVAGSWQGAAASLSGSCRMLVDDTVTGFSTPFGQSTGTFTGGSFPSKSGTFAMTSVTSSVLTPGSHTFEVQCNEGDGDIRMHSIQMSIVGLGTA